MCWRSFYIRMPVSVHIFLCCFQAGTKCSYQCDMLAVWRWVEMECCYSDANRPLGCSKRKLKEAHKTPFSHGQTVLTTRICQCHKIQRWRPSAAPMTCRWAWILIPEKRLMTGSSSLHFRLELRTLRAEPLLLASGSASVLLRVRSTPREDSRGLSPFWIELAPVSWRRVICLRSCSGSLHVTGSSDRRWLLREPRNTHPCLVVPGLADCAYKILIVNELQPTKIHWCKNNSGFVQ